MAAHCKIIQRAEKLIRIVVVLAIGRSGLNQCRLSAFVRVADKSNKPAVFWLQLRQLLERGRCFVFVVDFVIPHH